jgi:nucleotide-binding universal stress UspA family protein
METEELSVPFPVNELLKTEREENVSLVVIGSHGRKNLSEVFLGDVSEKVVRQCISPVLLIKRSSTPH